MEDTQQPHNAPKAKTNYSKHNNQRNISLDHADRMPHALKYFNNAGTHHKTIKTNVMANTKNNNTTSVYKKTQAFNRQ